MQPDINHYSRIYLFRWVLFFSLPLGIPQAAITAALTCWLGCEWHINSILRSVVRELIFHHVILTLWV